MPRKLAFLAMLAFTAGCQNVRDVSHEEMHYAKIKRTCQLVGNCQLWRQSSPFAKYTILVPVGRSEECEGVLPAGTEVVERIVRETQRPLLRSPKFDEVQTDYAIVTVAHPRQANTSVRAAVMFAYLREK